MSSEGRHRLLQTSVVEHMREFKCIHIENPRPMHLLDRYLLHTQPKYYSLIILQWVVIFCWRHGARALPARVRHSYSPSHAMSRSQNVITVLRCFYCRLQACRKHPVRRLATYYTYQQKRSTVCGLNMCHIEIYI